MKFTLRRSSFCHSLRKTPLLILVGTLSSQLLAMPAYNSDSQVNKLRADLLLNDPLLNTAEIFGDHAGNRKLYVSPSHRKVQAGIFKLEATPACEILSNQYALTYMVPSVPAAEWSEVALRGPVSAYFDFSYGNYLRNQKLIHEMAEKIGSIEQTRSQHRDVVAEYEAALAQYEFKAQEKEAAQLEYDKYPLRIKELTQLLIAAGGDAALMEAYRDEIAATRSEFSAAAPRLVKLIAETTTALTSASTRLSTAKGAYSSAIPNETVILTRINTLSTLFDTLQTSSKKVFDDNNKILMALETAGVGVATASYSIWADEVTRLKDVASKSGLDVDVWRLPLYDIRLAPPQLIRSESTIAPSATLGSQLNNAATLALVNNATAPLTSSTDVNASPFTRNGQLVQTRIATLGDDGARTYSNVVTRGAYCTGSSERNFMNSTVTDGASGSSGSFSLQVGVYKPRVNSVLSQSVALSYTYNLKNEPVDISCEMDIQKFSSWTSKQKTSGFLFWRKKKSSEERRMIQENGIRCTNHTNDFGAGGAERSQAIMDQMTQEIGAEYILQYAKSYEITGYKESELPNPGAAAEKMGTAMGALCAGNVYCQVGSIVLKTGNELFGSASGGATGSESISGKISRHYKEHAYTSLPGQAVIDLTVSL